MFKNKKFLFSLFISILFLYLAFGNLKFDQLAQSFTTINLWFLPLGVLIFFSGVWVRCLRWSYQLNHLKKQRLQKIMLPITAFTVLPSLTIGYFANNILPARAGELFRTFSWSKTSGMSKSAVLATIVIERLFDGLAMVSLALITSFFLPATKEMTFIIKIGAGLFLSIFCIAFLLVLFPALGEKVLQSITRYIPHQKTKDILLHLYHSFLDSFKLLPDIKSITVMYALSILAWLLEAMVFAITAWAFSIQLPYYALIFTAAIASLWTLIPSSPGYAGTFDFATIQSLNLFAITPEIAGSYTVVLHLILWLPITVLGGFYAWKEGVTFSRVKKK